MNKTTILLIITCVAIGFVGVCAYFGILSQLSQSLANVAKPIINLAQRGIVKAQEIWISIPEMLRGIIVTGVPLLVSTIFLAWTKIRAMQKLQQTQLEAQTQVSDLQTKVVDTTASNLNLQRDFETAQTKLSALTEKEQMLLEQKQSLEDQLSKAEKEVLRVQAESNALAHIDQEKVAELVWQRMKDEERVP